MLGVSVIESGFLVVCLLLSGQPWPFSRDGAGAFSSEPISLSGAVEAKPIISQPKMPKRAGLVNWGNRMAWWDGEKLHPWANVPTLTYLLPPTKCQVLVQEGPRTWSLRKIPSGDILERRVIEDGTWESAHYLGEKLSETITLSGYTDSDYPGGALRTTNVWKWKQEAERKIERKDLTFLRPSEINEPKDATSSEVGREQILQKVFPGIQRPGPKGKASAEALLSKARPAPSLSKELQLDLQIRIKLMGVEDRTLSGLIHKVANHTYVFTEEAIGTHRGAWNIFRLKGQGFIDGFAVLDFPGDCGDLWVQGSHVLIRTLESQGARGFLLFDLENFAELETKEGPSTLHMAKMSCVPFAFSADARTFAVLGESSPAGPEGRPWIEAWIYRVEGDGLKLEARDKARLGDGVLAYSDKGALLAGPDKNRLRPIGGQPALMNGTPPVTQH